MPAPISVVATTVIAVVASKERPKKTEDNPNERDPVQPILKDNEEKEKITESEVNREDIEKVQVVLDELELTYEELLSLDDEEEISNAVRLKFDELDSGKQNQLIEDFRDYIDKIDF
ncbi:hypothetical protein BJP34_21640 [Moorena producens PAL-8-15-08-1]|uniref:Uncharacterized protein n=1 Tax=Moorena producens PAL-8-15-08-1 TaxID=1458985 RepID=A0A1D8TVT9_9CYAN|nr:hypothetical protein [Moorena producens]AOX01694.1 hypothetical protein BJP34_21640 [Moorena producens PAL-8-15-08-1]